MIRSCIDKTDVVKLKSSIVQGVGPQGSLVADRKAAAERESLSGEVKYDRKYDSK